MARGAEAVIPPNPTRKHPHTPMTPAPIRRNLTERMFCRLKDFQRIATGYDKRIDIFLSALCLAAALTWWTPIESEAQIDRLVGIGTFGCSARQRGTATRS